MNEEAKLSDFKRKATKEALSVKFGAILELAEKATVSAHLLHASGLELTALSLLRLRLSANSASC